MYKKSERTIERYIEAGAWARLFELVGHRMIDAMSPVILVKEIDRMIDMMRKFGAIKAGADSQLFRDYPEISNDALHLFYGDLSQGFGPCGDFDRQVIERAKEIASGLLARYEKNDDG